MYVDLIHFNCLIGENNKINKMKELNEWFFVINLLLGI